jgi:5'-nucleotidase
MVYVVTIKKATLALLSAIVFILFFRMRSVGSKFVVPRIGEFERKLQRLVVDGHEKLQVIADFDRTITTCFNDTKGTRGMSAFGIIEEQAGNDGYKRACKVLFEKYYPIEIHPNKTENEKIPHMVAWYTQVHKEWFKAGISRSTISLAVKRAMDLVIIRPGFEELVIMAQQYNVPVIIFSAGIGDVISELLKQKLGETVANNIGIVSNWMKFGGEGGSAPLIGWSEPLIHMFNKDARHSASMIGGHHSLAQMKHRTNVIVLGDGTGDATMAGGPGSNAETVLKIGFLNEQVEKRSEEYNRVFDAVITNDGTMDEVNTILEKVIAGGSGAGTSKL